MPKFFVISDIHGFYSEMINALSKAGFNKENKDHWLISCGDCFDRGGQPIEVMEYLEALPRKILIKGNHEDLLIDLCKRKYFYSYDESNGTLDTVIEFAKLSDNEKEGLDYNFVLNKTTPFINSMVDYFETENYIFVHSWIPLIRKDGMPAYYTKNRSFEFNNNWRNASSKEWENARWGNPFDLAAQGLLPDKTTIFGHWHCSTGHSLDKETPEFGDGAIWDIYHDKENKLIAIDRCTAYTGECNVLVIEDNFLEVEDNEN